MSVFTQSRHVNLEVLSDDNDIDFLPLRVSTLGLDLDDNLSYTVQTGDNFPLIAANVWGPGNESLWWIIADFNNIFDPLQITEGIILTVPTLVNALLIAQSVNL